MRISFVTPIWGRPILTRLFLIAISRHIRHAILHHPDALVDAIIVGSEGDASRELVATTREPLLHYVEHPNEPLGDKFNAGIRHALAQGSDYVLIMGSDQFFLPSFLDLWINEARAATPYSGVPDLFMYDPDAHRAAYWPGYSNHRAGQPIGPGRLIHRSLLEPYDGTLYRPDLARDLDATADANLPAPKLIPGKRHLFTSIKTPGSITPLHRFPDAQDVPVSTIYPVLPS